MPKVLVSDKLAIEGVEILKRAADVDVNTGLKEDELCEIIGNYDALVIRSGTQVTAKVLEHAKNLKIIGRAGVGVDNVDVPVATEKGIIVVNSPGGNTLAAAELAVGLLMALARNIPQAYVSMKNKEWQRSKYTGHELYAKTIAVLGLGKIGQEVAKRCQAFDMKVVAYDPFLTQDKAASVGVELVELNDALKQADYITLHLPRNKQTTNMISDAQFEIMKDGVQLINCARGGIIDDNALVKAIKTGKCAGAALDVYPTEPPDFTSELFDMPNVITTPHLGASTEEAQTNVAVDVAEQIVDVFNGKSARAAVNLPAVSPEQLSAIGPYLPLAEKLATLAVMTTDGRPAKIEIKYGGDLAKLDTGPVGRSVIVGLLRPILEDSINTVNAPLMAKMRGIEVVESKTPDAGDYVTLLGVTITTDLGTNEFVGTLYGAKDIRVIKMSGYPMDFLPEGYMLFSLHTDKPGVIGKVGSLLGNAGVNIASMYVGRKKPGETAIMVLGIDSEISDNILNELTGIAGIKTAKQVVF